MPRQVRPADEHDWSPTRKHVSRPGYFQMHSVNHRDIENNHRPHKNWVHDYFPVAQRAEEYPVN